MQIAKEASALTTFHRLQVLTFVGGTSIDRDRKAIARPMPADIVIATPGRLLGLLEESPAFQQIAQ